MGARERRPRTPRGEARTNTNNNTCCRIDTHTLRLPRRSARMALATQQGRRHSGAPACEVIEIPASVSAGAPSQHTQLPHVSQNRPPRE